MQAARPRCCSSSSVTRRDPAERHRAHAAAGRAARPGRRATSAARCASRCRRSPRHPRDEWAIDDVAPAGRRERRLARAGRGLRGGGAARRGGVRGGRGARAAGDAGRAPTSASWRIPSWRSRATRRSSSSRPRTPRRWRRSSASTSRPGASPTCSPSTTRSCELAKSKAEELEIRFKLAVALRGGDQAAGQGDRALSGDPRRRIREQLPALVGARSPLSAARPLEGAGGDDHARRSISRPTWPRSPS